MPFYDFKCVSCGHVVELLRKHDDPNKPLCEKCNGVMTTQISVAAPVHFKVPGFPGNDLKKRRR